MPSTRVLLSPPKDLSDFGPLSETMRFVPLACSGLGPLRSSSNVVSSYYLVLNLLYWQYNILGTAQMSLLQSLSLLSSVCTNLLAFILQRLLGIIIKQV